MENFKLKSFDGTELYCYLFDKVENPKGVVMVVHGMGEHMGRYYGARTGLKTQWKGGNDFPA